MRYIFGKLKLLSFERDIITYIKLKSFSPREHPVLKSASILKNGRHLEFSAPISTKFENLSRPKYIDVLGMEKIIFYFFPIRSAKLSNWPNGHFRYPPSTFWTIIVYLLTILTSKTYIQKADEIIFQMPSNFFHESLQNFNSKKRQEAMFAAILKNGRHLEIWGRISLKF